MKYFVLALFILIPSAQAKILVSNISGASRIFKSTKQVQKISFKTPVHYGDIIATSKNNSTSIIDFGDVSNGVIILGSDTQVIIKGEIKRGLIRVVLIKGELHYKTLKKYKKRKPGVIFSIRSIPKLYYARELKMTYTRTRQIVINLSKDLLILDLKK